MSLIEQVQNICNRLAPYGWRDLLLLHGLDITVEDLKTELLRDLPNINRGISGFNDFAIEGKRGIEPGNPARSLLYHAFASTTVTKGPNGDELKEFPTLAEIEVIENCVFGIQAPTIQQLLAQAHGDPIAIVIFAAEYRSATETIQKNMLICAFLVQVWPESVPLNLFMMNVEEDFYHLMKIILLYSEFCLPSIRHI
jgi:hypothetical protein